MNNVFCLSRFDFKIVVKEMTEQMFMSSAFICVNEPKRDFDLFGDCSTPILDSAENVLNLWFDDAEEQYPDVPEAVLFDEETALTVREFFLKNTDKKNWFVHCTMGICRSGAIGEVISSQLGNPYHLFKRDNPKVKPNILVKSLLNKAFEDYAQQISVGPVGPKDQGEADARYDRIFTRRAEGVVDRQDGEPLQPNQ